MSVERCRLAAAVKIQMASNENPDKEMLMRASKLASYDNSELQVLQVCCCR